MDAGFFRGTSAEQDNRFSNKQKKLLKQLKFAECLEKKVDMTKVNLEVIKPWITQRVTEILGFEDDVVIEFIFNQLEEKNPDSKMMQINLTGFLNGKNAREFMKDLWPLLLSAQENIAGIPTAFLEQKKEEIKQRQIEQEKLASLKKIDDEKREKENKDRAQSKSPRRRKSRSPSPRRRSPVKRERKRSHSRSPRRRPSPLASPQPSPPKTTEEPLPEPDQSESSKPELLIQEASSTSDVVGESTKPDSVTEAKDPSPEPVPKKEDRPKPREREKDGRRDRPRHRSRSHSRSRRRPRSRSRSYSPRRRSSPRRRMSPRRRSPPRRPPPAPRHRRSRSPVRRRRSRSASSSGSSSSSSRSPQKRAAKGTSRTPPRKMPRQSDPSSSPSRRRGRTPPGPDSGSPVKGRRSPSPHTRKGRGSPSPNRLSGPKRKPPARNESPSPAPKARQVRSDLSESEEDKGGKGATADSVQQRRQYRRQNQQSSSDTGSSSSSEDEGQRRPGRAPPARTRDIRRRRSNSPLSPRRRHRDVSPRSILPCLGSDAVHPLCVVSVPLLQGGASHLPHPLDADLPLLLAGDLHLLGAILPPSSGDTVPPRCLLRREGSRGPLPLNAELLLRPNAGHLGHLNAVVVLAQRDARRFLQHLHHVTDGAPCCPRRGQAEMLAPLHPPMVPDSPPLQLGVVQQTGALPVRRLALPPPTLPHRGVNSRHLTITGPFAGCPAPQSHAKPKEQHLQAPSQ
ncbi:serine/arginine repetitive matrix protein 1 isoform X4 [Denticeps clupeoides]|uniref:serine/arginine repetitive matrix protein 1 isoform X4 n=1 Tax=Denticeps clupeoides TaxID=299321 RepID=UPI0010A33342|nr:serine/arginine repetitive matrix protein 1 isoform X4 [Denticeps clupeoides]